jgi:hypothetical protein
MRPAQSRTAFLVLSDRFNSSLIDLYRRVSTGAGNRGDTFILLHNKSGGTIPGLADFQSYEFSDEVLTGLNYRPIYQTLVPGSNLSRF